MFTVTSVAEQINIAYGKTDTVTGAVPHDGYGDTDGKELTDGAINGLGDQPDSTGYVADEGSFSVIIDLGAIETNLTKFVVYNTYTESWGISKMANVVISICDTQDGTYTNVASISADAAIAQEITWGWNPYIFITELDEGVSGRYVKFDITTQGSFFWSSEIEVYSDSSTAEESQNETPKTNDNYMMYIAIMTISIFGAIIVSKKSSRAI